MKCSRWRVLTVTLIAGFIVGLLFNTAGVAHNSSAQDTEKSLDIERYPNEPLEIIDIKVSEQSLKSKITVKERRGHQGLDNVKFKEKAEWFRRVWVRLRNTSDKPITGLQAYLYFKVPGSKTLFGVGLETSTLLKRGVVDPGDEVDLTVSDKRWGFTADILKEQGADVNLAAVTLSIERVWFSKELQWSKGHFLRRDPDNPNKWIPIDKSSSVSEKDSQNEKADFNFAV